MRDIILVLSDQHSGLSTSYMNSIVNTPCLENLIQTSQTFEYAYCNNPLCVPSRMSFLTGKCSSEIGIFDNNVVLPSDIPTIADKLNEKGYRSVLVGRMHFKGNDQHHGFNERYVGDITTQWWNQKRDDLGAFQGTLQMKGCLKEYGFGNSPVQEYDEAVVNKALEVLTHKDERPLFMVIGLYGPHFPYCVEEEYFNHYYDLDLNTKTYEKNCWNEYQAMQMQADESTLQHIRSAYYGLVEKLDMMIGKLHEAARKAYEDCVFIYTSDHGEQIGNRKLFGKKTLYEESIRVPMVIEDLHQKPQVHKNEVSLLNLHAQICRYADVECDLEDLNDEKAIIISSLIENDGEEMISQAVVWKHFKYICCGHEERLIDLNHDEYEEVDVKDRYPEILNKLKKHRFDEKKAVLSYKQRKEELEILKEEFKKNPQEDWIRYKIREKATVKPSRRKYGEI